jgi:sulfur-oxidizing protein SoxY
MTKRGDIGTLDRRTFLLAAGAAALLPPILTAASARAENSAGYREALAGLLQGASPVAGSLVLDLPENVENGDYVPVALSVDSPMTAADHVEAIHILSTENPRAEVATFRLTLLSGRARVTSRMRLARTQEVVAVAELSGGRLLMTGRRVEVKIGGCGI